MGLNVFYFVCQIFYTFQTNKNSIKLTTTELGIRESPFLSDNFEWLDINEI